MKVIQAPRGFMPVDRGHLRTMRLLPFSAAVACSGRIHPDGCRVFATYPAGAGFSRCEVAGPMHDDLPGSNDDLLSYSISQGPGYAVVSVAGQIDASTEGKFRDALTSVLARGVLRIVVNLAGVTFMGSPGIAVLIGARRLLAAEGGSLALAAPRGEVA